MTFSSRKLQVCKSLVVFVLIGVLGTTGVVFAKAKRHAAAGATSIVKQKPKVTEAGADNPEGTQADAKASAPGEPLADLAAPVQPVVTPPLRDIPPIPWWEAPVSEHPEPVLVEGPIDTKIPDISTMQLVPGPQSSAPTPTGVSWDGVGVGLAGFSPNGNPPDVNGRVGGTQYVQWNNTSFAVFDKTTGALLYGPASGNTLFQSLGGACATHNDGDPVVAYDILAGRWILSQFVVAASPNASHQCVAVSATQDATGAYYLYDFVTDTTNLIDYPKIGVWPDGYYMSAHAYNAAGTSFLNGRIYVFERTQMIQGLPARMQFATLGSQFGFLPADLDSLTPPPAGEAEFLVGPSTSTALASTRVTVTWGGTPTIATLVSTIPISTAGTPPCSGGGRRCVPQPAPALSTDNLDSLSNHMMYRLAYRNFGGSPVQESLVATSLGLGSTPTPTHGVIRWYELRNAGVSTTAPTVFQFSSFNPDNVYRFMASIAMDNSHDIAVGYSKSSSTVLPSIWINGRLGTDTVNTLGTEAQVQAGAGVQMVVGTSDPGNRWGDYSSMTVDPVDQCTFYYTNEYLKSNGGFNWSTRIASYKFPSCTAAAAWGTVSGTITSCATGAPISGVTVTLSNGYAAASNASGVYSILVPAGSYTAAAAGTNRSCASAVPSSASVNPPSGGTASQDFCMNGASILQANGLTFDDSSGNANGVINSNECVNLNLAVKNNGCGTETGISATLTTSTPGVTIVQGASAYPDLVIDASSVSATPFKIQTSGAFLCGTTINFSLNLTYASGSKTLSYSVHTCEGGADQTIPANTLTTADLTQADRIGRNAVPSTCAGKTCPGGGFAGTKYYKTFNFTNVSGSAECFTVTINAAAGGAGDIESQAYLGTYDPANLCTNELGDTGIVGLGTTVTTASYSFQVAAQSNFVVVVNTTGTTTSSQFSGTVSGFVTTAAGPGACVVSCTGAPNGTPCNDSNACTQTDTCQNDVCVGSNPVVCTAADQCHVAGTCNPANGTCSNPTAADGTGCSDGNACTQSDSCQSGACIGTNPVTCSASDQCHTTGTCAPATGICSNPAAPNGTACNDGNACTQTDTCQSGTCSGSNPVTCTASNQCHTAGTCNPASGLCSNPTRPDGSACNDGNACTQFDTCQAGTCSGGNPVTCTALDQCHTAGTCDPANGTCSNPAAADGTGCSDGNACTQSDSCQSGACVGASPVICSASDQCHVAGTCDPANGTCSNPAAPNGTDCSDGNNCTIFDTCLDGSCSPGLPPNCNDNNPCTFEHCDNAIGCVFVNNTEPCDDGNACTVGDTCGGGVCNSGTAIPAPEETQNVAVDADKSTYSWSAAASATQYDVVRGSLAAFPVGPGGVDETCFDDLSGPSLNDATVPSPGTGFWYLSRGENACGTGTFGTQGVNGVPGVVRATTTCP